MGRAKDWRRRGAPIVISVLLCAGCALVAGVDFDHAAMGTDEGADASVDGSLRVPGPDANGATDAPAPSGDGSITSDASIKDAAFDAPDAFDAGPAKVCDGDNDGFLAIDCGGDDCDDTDPRTHPDAGWITDPPVPPRSGDWDCSGVVDRFWPTPFVACSSGSLGCSQKNGFVVDTQCGGSGTFKQCGVQNNACVLFVTYTNKQPCR